MKVFIAAFLAIALPQGASAVALPDDIDIGNGVTRTTVIDYPGGSFTRTLTYPGGPSTRSELPPVTIVG